MIPRWNGGWHGAADSSVSMRGTGSRTYPNRGNSSCLRGPPVPTSPTTRGKHGSSSRQANGRQSIETQIHQS